MGQERMESKVGKGRVYYIDNTFWDTGSKFVTKSPRDGYQDELKKLKESDDQNKMM